MAGCTVPQTLYPSYLYRLINVIGITGTDFNEGVITRSPLKYRENQHEKIYTVDRVRRIDWVTGRCAAGHYDELKTSRVVNDVYTNRVNESRRMKS